MAEITFTHLPPLNLDVAGIELDEAFVAPLEPPHVEGDLPVAPADAAKRWVTDRLVPVGATRVARVTLEDASAIEQGLATEGGISGLFTAEQAKRFVVTVAMRIEIVDEGTRFVEGFATGTATRSVTIAEDATLDDRDRVLLRLVEATMQEFDRNLELSMRRHLARFLR
ncbi:MAG: hypothetical protein EXQ94_00080 [Alphaproteobacteria bacterium]|nr:hypothetical protein [Alphaproteobacteria bacterium]